MTTSIVTRHTTDLEWRARNPLRAWRARSGTRAQTVAHRLGVSKIAIMYWESGRRTPRKEYWRRLAEVTGTADIERRWLHWMAERAVILSEEVKP